MTTPQPPDGYRLLTVDDRIHAGDIAWNGKYWQPVRHKGGKWSPNLYRPMARMTEQPRVGTSGIIWTPCGTRVDADGIRVVRAKTQYGYPSEFPVTEWQTMRLLKP